MLKYSDFCQIHSGHKENRLWVLLKVNQHKHFFKAMRQAYSAQNERKNYLFFGDFPNFMLEKSTPLMRPLQVFQGLLDHTEDLVATSTAN